MPPTAGASSLTDVSFRVLAHPGQSTTRARGFDPWRKAWKVDVAAPAEKDQANRELLRFLGEALGARTGEVVLVSGTRGRLKQFRWIDGRPDLLERSLGGRA